MLTYPYCLPQDSATPADWQRFWQLVEQDTGLTERQVRAMMGRMRLLPNLSTPEGYAQASAGHRGANLAHLYFKVRGWTAAGYHFPNYGQRQSAPATWAQWMLVRFSEITGPPTTCHGCRAPLPDGYWHCCPACLTRSREN